ncbi:N-acetyl sugar amidotransferase [Emticicia sp. C21]|uniref:N-acetyl sugar amidotransferase n=1 Tax=Emticicia sp. C21 TaxID=2302915 RepID=UPI000E34FD03|nr:N-acetyl sugar amidotransferase [Emticicia sp. C21]RFS17237.1 N-acetyl sugar amidotransferase [Emticicia sp. C21]
MQYKICKKCVMDETDPLIEFDEAGICNYCRDFEKIGFRQLTDEEIEQNLLSLKQKLASAKKGKYDCIIGLSGGVDSSYVALLAKKLELNPLLVHFDNGWNSELAVKNINNIVNSLQSDLHTLVVDWEEFRNLQRAYFDAGVVDIEVLTDHAIIATIYKLAEKYRIKYILSGTNISTEFVLPKSWVHSKIDLSNLKDIVSKNSRQLLKTYPTINSLKIKLYYEKLKGIRKIQPLNIINYNKEHAIKELIDVFGWRNYGRKHGESIFTKFYQNHILPTKFNIDKRKAHLSSLICSNQLSREEALMILNEPLYDKSELETDYGFVRKKLGYSKAEFDAYLERPPSSHFLYKSDLTLLAKIHKIKRKLQ